MKPTAEGPSTRIALRSASSGGKNRPGQAVDELAAAYRFARGTPAARMPALRGVLRGYLDACAALVDQIPATSRRAKLECYLKRLHELRAHSLPPGDWRLDVLEWLRSEVNSLQCLRDESDSLSLLRVHCSRASTK